MLEEFRDDPVPGAAPPTPAAWDSTQEAASTWSLKSLNPAVSR
jgi:hypothetical protein